MSDAHPANDFGPTPSTLWHWSGALLIASTVVQSPIERWTAVLGALLLVAGLVVFIVGGSTNLLRGETATTVSLAFVALWIVVSRVLPIPFPDQGDPLLPLQSNLFAALSLLAFGAAAVAAVSLGRNQRLPGRWRWAPAWTLAGYLVIWLGVHVVFLSDPEGAAANGAVAIVVAEWAAGFVPVFLGVLLILLTSHASASSAQPKVDSSAVLPTS